jgi:short-subunit dehydrogenase
MTHGPAKTVLITGVAGGIGRALAREFAAEGCDIIGADRSAEGLAALAREWALDFPGTQLIAIEMDLAARSAAEDLYGECTRLGREVDILVNNVGFGKMGEHVLQSLDVLTDMLSLNNLLMTKLCVLFGRDMKARGNGQILNVASLVGLSSSPFFSAYSGTKAYVIAFSVGLGKELADYGVQVSCLCPGTTDTGFLDSAAIDDPSSTGMRRFASAFIASPETVARAGLRGLRRKEKVIVPTMFLRAQAAALRLIPIEIMAGFVHRKVVRANRKGAT